MCTNPLLQPDVITASIVMSGMVLIASVIAIAAVIYRYIEIHK